MNSWCITKFRFGNISGLLKPTPTDTVLQVKKNLHTDIRSKTRPISLRERVRFVAEIPQVRAACCNNGELAVRRLQTQPWDQTGASECTFKWASVCVHPLIQITSIHSLALHRKKAQKSGLCRLSREKGDQAHLEMIGVGTTEREREKERWRGRKERRKGKEARWDQVALWLLGRYPACKCFLTHSYFDGCRSPTNTLHALSCRVVIRPRLLKKQPCSTRHKLGDRFYLPLSMWRPKESRDVTGCAEVMCPSLKSRVECWFNKCCAVCVGMILYLGGD